MTVRGRAAVFLDRDGTIIEDVGYIADPTDVRFFSGAAQAIARMNRAGLLVVVVSNQSGLARGYFDYGQMWAVQRRVEEGLRAAGADLDGFYFCPHHEEGSVAELALACDCRKPRPGMILQAAEELGIDLAASFMIGDRLLDVACGRAAGVSPIMVSTGHQERAEADDQAPDFMARDLAEAVEYILNNRADSA